MFYESAIATVFIVLFHISSFGQTTIPDPGKTAYQNQDYKQALSIYRACIEKESSNLLCLEKGGMSAYRLGDFKEAKILLLQLIEVDSLNKTALIQLAGIYEQEENTPKAIKFYTTLSKLYPNNPIYLRKLGQQYQKAKLLKEAFSYFGKAYQINNRDIYCVRGLSEILLTNQQYELADSILQEALIVDSSNVAFTLLFAQSQYQQKRYKPTVEFLKKIRSLVDLNNYHNKMLGYAYLQIDSVDQSIYYLHKSLVDEGNPEYAHYYLASAYEMKEDTESAKHHYQKAIEAAISKNTSLYHRNMARLLNEENDLRAAIPHYEDAIKYGNDPVVLFYLARAADAYYKDKNIAIRYYNRYLKLAIPTKIIWTMPGEGKGSYKNKYIYQIRYHMQKLTKAEEEIMQLFWNYGPSTVSALIEKMEHPHPPHSSISSIVRILEKKGFVNHKAYGRTYEYIPIIAKKEYSKFSITRLVKDYFEGSMNELVSFLVKENDVSLKELGEVMDKMKED